MLVLFVRGGPVRISIGWLWLQTVTLTLDVVAQMGPSIPFGTRSYRAGHFG